ncbi:hypothetical protein EsDP_00001009 [Epichloe bromicola]|uniref:Aminoglycoside phosphotransferase domain-containing protein n=1 Tax=Epichloe bromicola TaxID=79588 RepID=A0ABQ0CH28_9HYPO
MSRPALVPDPKSLSGIFKGAGGVELANCHVIMNTPDACTFHLHCDSALFQKHPKDLLVRLQTSDLADVASIQRLAYTRLPDLVPPILDVGDTLSANATKLHHCITPFYTDAVPLSNVWDMLERDQQHEMMDLIVSAVEKLQDFEHTEMCLGSNNNSRGFDNLKYGKGPADAPRRACTCDTKRLIYSIVGGINESSRLLETDDGIVLEPLLKGMVRLELTSSELEELQKQVVLCHMDLEPRNVLVKERPDNEGGRCRYDLVAIIDWEMAGFYPFAYERGIKDTALGSSNLSFSWYSLFKQKTCHLLPSEDCHGKLLQLLWFVSEARKRQLPRNVGVRVQAKWVNRESIQRAADPRQGWIRKTGCSAPRTFTKEDQESLEHEVLKELGLG